MEQIQGGGSIQGGSITLTGSIQALPDIANQATNVWLQVPSGNADSVFIVASYTDDICGEIEPSGRFSVDLMHPPNLRFTGTAGQVVYWGVLI